MNKTLKNISINALKILDKHTFNKNEQWKYTNINNFKKIGLESTAKIAKKYLKQQASSSEITIINNQVINQSHFSKEIIISNIDKALEENLENCTNIFNKITPNNKNEFILSNTAYFKKGVFIHFNNNTKIKEPIYINNIIDYSGKTEFLNCRYLFSFGKNVSAKIIIKNIHLSVSYLNTLYELFINDKSNIDLIIESSNNETTEINNFSSDINKNAKLNIYPICISSKLIKNNYFIYLKEKKSIFNYNGINLLDRNNHVDNYIEINHENKYTISNTNQKNILKGKSKSIFNSKAKININSSNSEAHQNNNNIILSTRANVHSNPQLEIYNNDVKCSHGSTTGELDDDILFYMRTRGLSINKAKNILLNSFLNDMIQPINIISYTENIKNKINNWLTNVN